MKKTKATKALLKALLASYNSYINNKKGWTPKEVQPFFCKIKGSSVKYMDAFIIAL